ncbi:MAG: ribonuclease III [Alphaproteobacteria bacterium RIFCSPLOWO2_01_FULL_40_26]|nr:MAG: ribonuclease III [Alphaproteobacteria bacterium RIFCSPHIGHO2_02_FULL_40_34]OFW94662.1 MAG: ribonuclease III [Alphaproteobacteria bacterium RIFCSPLOWO2_01_FULL_40_26]OFX10130.1 MAG: ribonuclease III [Alphaproteobacteria bacterium RIFCSPLOWO2_02_FULL_40_19]OFX11759.1 MAG: ribonuclease III [Alphaproteobacteria bacterium RIFCSPLOWO2_12_FULL_40_11]
MNSDFKNFCKKISYEFNNEKLLEEALTHPSLSKENKSRPNYQRLEFLGDKVLGLVIGEFLMKKYPHEMEGPLSRRQAALVSGEALAEIALIIGLEEVLQISNGERKLGGKTNKRNLENALEALIGAIYLDSNFDEAKNFILKFWRSFLEKNIEPPKDPVSQLQELAQFKTKKLPEYHTIQDGGFDHSPTFTSTVKISALGLEFSAHGKSKKEAQKEAAKIALNHLLK